MRGLNSVSSNTRLPLRYNSALSIKGQNNIGYDTVQIKRTAPTTSKQLRLATMHRVKGLEFDHVFLVGLNKAVIPLPQALKEADQNDETSVDRVNTIERCLLYVSITRAKKTVSLTSHGKMTDLLPES